MKSAKIVAVIAALSWVTFAHAAAPENIHSQYRHPNETFEQALNSYYLRLEKSGMAKRGPGRTPKDASVPFELLSYSKVPIWTGGLKEIYQAFNDVRDLRFLESKAQPGFARRVPWLFPDDGCYARAGLQGQEIEKLGHVRPAKVYIFGELELKTPNSPDRAVTWWYHQASVVSDGTNIWVLDPAVEPKKPIQIIEWLTSVAPRPDSVNVAICAPYAYSPSSLCYNPVAAAEQTALVDVVDYLDEEWKRIGKLGRKPDQELGDNPPWKN